MSHKIPTTKLADGYEVPLLGLGTWLSKPGEVQQAIKDAIDAGYRHFDCAFFYQNEGEIGEGIQAKISEGVVKREDIFITTKAWCNSHSREMLFEACQKSLQNLKVDYIDLYLIHWPVGFKEGESLLPSDKDGNTLYSDIDYMETWKAMEECRKRGWVRSIGVSNFNSKQIKRVCSEGNVRPVMNQVECHPYLSQRKLQKLCESLGIKLTAYCPLGSPYRKDLSKITLTGLPSSYKSHMVHSQNLPMLLEEPVVKEIGDNHNKTPAQVLLRYLVQRGIVAVPKSVTKERIISNSQIFDFELAPGDMDKLYELDRDYRFVMFEWGLQHKEYPFSIPY